MFYSGNKVTATWTQSQIAWVPVQWGFFGLLLCSLFLPFVGCVILDKFPKPPPGLYFWSLGGLLGDLRVSPHAVLLWGACALSVSPHSSAGGVIVGPCQPVPLEQELGPCCLLCPGRTYILILE